jgi:hypothetical protein
MKTVDELLKDLPELPVALFELGARMALSETVPVLTNRPHVVEIAPPTITTPRENKSRRQVRQWFAWALYPKVICYPLSDPVVYSGLRPIHGNTELPTTIRDLTAVANVRRYYRRPSDGVLGNAICEVRYGPWFATVTERESCDDQVPNMWELSSQDPGISLSWLGIWEDCPTVQHLTVVVNLNDVAKSWSECCPGFTFCPTSQSCLRNTITCPDAHPV